MQVNQRASRLGETVEITITASLLNLSPNSLFFLPGANAYRLKLLMPEGFVQTGGDFTDYVGDQLSYPAKPVVTYRIWGRFHSVAEGSSFRLLRSNHQATDQSLYVEKARVNLKSITNEMLTAQANSTDLGVDAQTLIIVSDPAPGVARARTAATSYRSSVEHARCESVGGWIINTASPRQSISLDIFINGTKAATVAADQERPDVATALGVSGFTRYGFTWAIPASYRTGAALKVSVRIAGTNQELDDSPRTTAVCPASTPPVTTTPDDDGPETDSPVSSPAPAARYRSSVEHARCESVGGWIINTASPRQSVNLDIFINGTKAATVTANEKRTDVAAAFGVSGFNRYGFTWAIPASYRTGAALKVSVRIAGTNQELSQSPRTTAVCPASTPPVTTTPEPTTPPVTTTPPATTTATPPVTTTPPATTTATPTTPAPMARYRSSVEHARCESVGGWIINTASPNQSISLDIFINGTKATTLTADLERPDVATALGVSGFTRYGFTWAIPASYRTGTALKVSVRIAGTSQELDDSPRTTAVCPASTPPVTTTPEPTTPPVTTTPPATTTATPPVTTTPPATTTATPTTPAPMARYRSSVEHARCESVGGWIINTASPNQSISLDIFINGTKATTLTADLERPDVATAFGVSGFTRYGFTWAIPASYRTGAALKVSVRIAGTSQELDDSPRTTAVCPASTPPVTTTPEPTTPPVTTTPPATTTATPPVTTTPPATTTATPTTPAPMARYRSTIEHARCESVGGWIINTASPNQSISLDIFINGTKATTLTADLERPDVATAFGVSGFTRYGFTWAIPASYRTGAALKISVRIAGTSQELDDSPRMTEPCGSSTTPEPTTPPVTTTPPATTTTTPPVTTPPVTTPPVTGNYPVFDSPRPDDQRPFLQNERVRVAIDLSVGGLIREVTDLQVGLNMINCPWKNGKRDTGRDDQIAIYAGPDANTGWTTGGSVLHDNIGYNPVQGGDILQNPSPILAFGKSDNMLYCKTRPLQWGLNNIPGDYIIEQWIQLQGNVVRRHVRITGNRPDTDLNLYTLARQQEMPCTYTNGEFYQYYVAQGMPYTNAPLTNVNGIQNLDGSGRSLNDYKGPPGQVSPQNIDASEPWIAAIRPTDNRGIALHTPFSHEFKVGLFGSPGYGPPESLNAGYIANSLKMNLDRNGVYEFDINMVVGTLSEIRNTMNTLDRSESKPNYVFAGQSKRHGFTYQRGYDQGYPVGDELSINPTTRRFSFTSPRKGYKASDVSNLFIRMRVNSSEKQLVLKWRKVGQSALAGEQAGQSITFPITGDNQYRTIVIPVSNHPQWNGVINEFSINYANPNEDSASGQQIGIKWLSAENLNNQ